MNDAGAVDGVEPSATSREHPERPRDVAMPPPHVVQRRARFDELHHEEMKPLLATSTSTIETTFG